MSDKENEADKRTGVGSCSLRKNLSIKLVEQSGILDYRSYSSKKMLNLSIDNSRFKKTPQKLWPQTNKLSDRVSTEPCEALVLSESRSSKYNNKRNA